MLLLRWKPLNHTLDIVGIRPIIIVICLWLCLGYKGGIAYRDELSSVFDCSTESICSSHGPPSRLPLALCFTAPTHSVEAL